MESEYLDGPIECIECKKFGAPTEGMTQMCPKCTDVVCLGHFDLHYKNCSGKLEIISTDTKRIMEMMEI